MKKSGSVSLILIAIGLLIQLSFFSSYIEAQSYGVGNYGSNNYSGNTTSPSLSFSITGISSGTTTAITGAQSTTTGASNATTISFGTFNSGTNAASQEIITTTNANNGYTVFMEENQPLTSGSATIGDISGTLSWNTSTTTGFGVNVTNGTNGDANTTLFTSNTLYSNIPIAPTLLSLASLATATNVSGDSEFINYQVGVSSSMNAGTYTNTLNYIVMPNF